ncbi:MAG: hypothetical protein KDJ80_05930, partial [Nitratireductor sp.]|nr:hypothetical protein [Nitratireductor sp.]
DPRAYLTALAAYVGNHPKGEIRQGIGVVDATADGAGVSVTLGDGARLHAGRAVIANGWEAYDLLARMGGGRGVAVGGRRVTGRGVKGQAVLIDIAHDDDLPILYDSGSYVVPQGAGMGADATGRASRIAVGSTSTDAWLDDGVAMDGSALEAARTGCDPADTGFLDHAVTFCPALSGAPIAESWANIRPRNTIADAITGKIGTEPATGPVDGTDRIRLAVGGFKIGFGIAHLSGAHAIGL